MYIDFYAELGANLSQDARETTGSSGISCLDIRLYKQKMVSTSAEFVTNGIVSIHLNS